MKAYHGTNTIFDRFDTSKAKEGVGAELICKGVNVATRLALADTYREKVSTPDSQFTAKLYFSRSGNALVGHTEEIDFLKSQVDEDNEKDAETARDRLEDLGVDGDATYGVIYELTVPGREHLLDWDGRVEDQPIDVIQVLRDLYGDDEIEEIYDEASELSPLGVSQDFFDDVFEKALLGGTECCGDDLDDIAPGYDWTRLDETIKQHCPNIMDDENEVGRCLYQSLAHSMGGEDEATRFLKEYGVYGVVTQREFTGLEGESEIIVIWNPDDVRIDRIVSPEEASYDYRSEYENYSMGP